MAALPRNRPSTISAEGVFLSAFSSNNFFGSQPWGLFLICAHAIKGSNWMFFSLLFGVMFQICLFFALYESHNRLCCIFFMYASTRPWIWWKLLGSRNNVCPVFYFINAQICLDCNGFVYPRLGTWFLNEHLKYKELSFIKNNSCCCPPVYLLYANYKVTGHFIL